jgi:hypothetical protein
MASSILALTYEQKSSTMIIGYKDTFSSIIRFNSKKGDKHG